jgi:hypothetical protein
MPGTAALLLALWDHLSNEQKRELIELLKKETAKSHEP